MRSNAILLAALLLFALAAAGEEKQIGAPAPVRLDAEKLAGLGLEEFEPFPKEIVLSGRSQHSYHTFFSGEEVVVEVYEAQPAKLKIDEPWPYDEFIYLLSGKLVITDAKGKVTQTEWAHWRPVRCVRNPISCSRWSTLERPAIHRHSRGSGGATSVPSRSPISSRARVGAIGEPSRDLTPTSTTW